MVRRSGICKDCGVKFDEDVGKIKVPKKHKDVCYKCVGMRDVPIPQAPADFKMKVKFINLSWPVKIGVFFSWFILIVWLYAIFRMFW